MNKQMQPRGHSNPHSGAKALDWAKLYSDARAQSDWLREIDSHGGTVAYWDSRAPDFTHGAEYYDRISSEIIGFVGPTSRLLEIGAGNGNFTLPFSRYEEEILAVEPAPKMIERLEERLNASKVKNVEIRRGSWDDVAITEKYDMVLFSHSIYFMEDISSAIEKAKGCADKAVVILSMVFDPADIYSRSAEVMSGRKWVSTPDYPLICMVCRQLGLIPEVRIVGTDAVYPDYSHLYSKLTNHLQEDILKEKKPEIENLIKTHPQVNRLPDGKWLVKNRFRTAIIKCEV